MILRFRLKMAGKDDDEVILQAFMVKRSQNKKLFTPVNYKERWLVLTRRALIYYDTDGEVNLIDLLRLLNYYFHKTYL